MTQNWQRASIELKFEQSMYVLVLQWQFVLRIEYTLWNRRHLHVLALRLKFNFICQDDG